MLFVFTDFKHEINLTGKASAWSDTSHREHGNEFSSEKLY
jgi:hypothetical protein